MHLGAALRVLAGGRATGWSMALIPGTEISQTPNAGEVERGSETAGISSVVERETAQIIG